MKKSIIAFSLFMILFCNNVALSMGDDQNYSISAWEDKSQQSSQQSSSIQWDYPKGFGKTPSEQVANKQTNEDSASTSTASIDDSSNDNYYYYDEGKSKVSKVLSFFKKRLPTPGNIKRRAKPLAIIALTVGAGLLFGYAGLKIATGLVSTAKSIVIGTSKVAAVTAALYFLSQMKKR